ncbi:MAG: F0F1 ATP synthase subunit alpha [Verrucomicrobiota bacterium]|nr:F0F1 ATP synthase subunit alpha [Verrucomicrobiota bacterium]
MKVAQPFKINLLQLKEYGIIVEIKEDVVHVTGLTNCMTGQLVNLGESARGVIVGFDSEYVLVLLVTNPRGIKPGDKAISSIEDFKIPVGDGFLGRRVNALAQPIDGGGHIKQSAHYPIFGRAPSVLERIPLAQVLETGTKVIDMMKPVGKGQRMLIIGDRMTGKTTICVDAILNQLGKNVVCVYCGIGKAEAALNRVIGTFDNGHIWDYGIVVAAKASDPMGQQYLTPYVAASIGEYFMREKRADVLVVFDDFTKHAWAWRQISLLLERAPGRDAYPGDIFYIHSQLVERACKLNNQKGGGSMTHLPIVETLQGDVAGYIPSNTISMTDGQIYTNTTLFGEGFKPAIDMGLSVSRIGNRVQWPAIRGMTKMLQLEFVRFKELERLTRIKAGVSADIEKRLRKGKILEELLKQDQNTPVPMEDQVIILFALQNGLLNDIEPAAVQSRLQNLIRQVRRNRPDLIQSLIEKKALTEDIKEGLHEQLVRFSDTAVQNQG